MKRIDHNNKPCPIAQSLGIIGDSWTLLILRNCFLQTKRFEDFQTQLGLTRHVLTDRLNKLVNEDILQKVPYGNSGSRFEYKLTPKGVALSPVFMMLANWGNEWLFNEGETPIEHVHHDCGQKFKPVMHCSSCGETVKANSISTKASANLHNKIKDEPFENKEQILGFKLEENE